MTMNGDRTKEDGFTLIADVHKAVSFYISQEKLKNLIVEDVTVYIRKDPSLLAAVVTLDSIFWSAGEVKSFEHPTTWWQMFKAQYFPMWLLKNFPVKKKRITIKEVATRLPKKFRPRLTAIEVHFETPDFQYDYKLKEETITCN
jgi:hypothetical protein